MAGPSALGALRVLARTEAEVHAGPSGRLRHLEWFTVDGLWSALWHASVGSSTTAAIVACGGAMGGMLGPGRALYQALGDRWSAAGVPVLRVGYRVPNDLARCTHDVACAVELAAEAGAERVVVLGHSFGGAVAVRTGVVMPELVAGVVTFATQSAGCEVAGALAGRPLLLFHGDADELLPPESSDVVAAIAGRGEVVRLAGDGHLLAASHDAMIERLDAWLPDVLGVDVPAG